MSRAATSALSATWFRAAEWHRDAGGRRRYGIAAGLGLVAALALPPFYILPLLLIAFPGLVWLLDGAANWRQAFLIAWAFAVGYFIAGLYWVGIAMTVDFARFGWFIPFSTLGLSAGLGLFPALTIAVAWKLGWKGAGRIPLLAAAWVLAEFLRSWVLTGFPWNQLGTVWGFHPMPQQLAAVTGIWGLSAVTLLASASPALLAERHAPGRGVRSVALVSYTILALSLAFGALRLAAAPEPRADEAAPRMRIVQPSIPQSEKWLRHLRLGHIETQLALSRQPGFETIDLLIWPETAVPFLLNRQPAVQQRLTAAVPPAGHLVAGTLELEQGPEGNRIYNVLHALDAQGAIVASYRKFHLVPFGEYVPFRSVLPIEKITSGKQDFTPGPGLTSSFAVGGLPAASALICYEIIFSGRVTAEGEPRPAWLLNLTNDAWFGHSSGPYQHFANATIRSIEEGLPLIRAANNGISAVVDGYGRVLGKLAINEIGIIDAQLPPALAPTIYAQVGRWMVALIVAVLAGWFFVLRPLDNPTTNTIQSRERG